ncbi:hypothetical protein NB311A_20501 [Nitrobacter sp. Nb-311A]|uniref:hypothetical protein n=1 Tax=Nitrobacter sp. Nb-311A TaxID=314253 RepID=UPI0000687AA8|nr:hypothetical protein [Nitrobacter sp. Nb-311A]EAQ36356.1 hypothetical protein NB311A_20501 [Nitrobacter sp. Nb-311A]
MVQRRRFKQSLPLGDRLSAFIHAMQERAELVGPGPQRDEILKKLKKAETAVEMDRAIKSGEPKPPSSRVKTPPE